jgi:hypothetical protein
MDPGRSAELAQMLYAASEQIGLAMIDSHSAVERLGGSLEQLALLLAQDLTGPDAQQRLAAVRAEMGQAITALQFYDRMTQHLSHVRDYLSGTVQELNSSSAAFDDLNRRLADRLLTDTHRVHLGRNFANEPCKSASRDRAAAGDIDLF